MMNIKDLKQRALAGDLSALEELRQLGVLSGNQVKYSMAPVSNAQRRLWFIDKMDQSPAYNLPAAILLEGHLNVDALEKTFREIIRRHEILRTSFVETDGVPYQKIIQEAAFTLPVQDRTDVANQEELISALAAEEANRCFDLSTGPLLVCRLMKLAETKYLLLFNMHHIISDGWSIAVLISELTQLYNAFSKGLPSPLDSLKIQYKDYAVRQEQLLRGKSGEEHKVWWLDKFSGDPSFTELPPDLKRPSYKSFNGRLYELEFDETIHARVNQLIQQRNVSLFMFLVTVVDILVSKYTGKNDVTVGSPVSGREQRDLEEQIGFYVNTIPLRNMVDPNQRFCDFLEKVRCNCIEAYDHQIYPFDLLIEELNMERDTSRNPLFELMVSLDELNADRLVLEGLQTTILKPDITFSKMDLHFNFEESAEGMKLGMIYNPDLYSVEWVERLGAHFLQLLENILTLPEEIIGKIAFITPEEKLQILNVFNNTTVDYPKEKTLIGLFGEMVEKYPGKPAVVYQGQPLTYASLNEKANVLAARLRNDYRLKLEEPVVILMDRSQELIISILGILKAGGAYLPIETNMPAERINMILEDVDTRIILTNKKLDEKAFAAVSVIHVTDDFLKGRGTTENSDGGKNSSNLAYILYTSGSTGTPKGSMIEDKSVIRLVMNNRAFCFEETDRFFSTSSMSFDATTLDLWGALLHGGTFYLEDQDDFLDPEKLKHYFSVYKINKAVFPTGFFVRMAEADEQNNLNLFEGLKSLLTGGDKLPPPVTNKFILRYPKCLVVNGYGPTENTSITTTFSVTRAFQEEIPIGKPISNTTVYIFNGQGNLCPIGVPGEIYIGGEGLSRGYVKRPELNAERFVENPFNPGEKLYRSGDRAQWLSDGNIFFIGRNDDQLKLRGFRVETGEIENKAAEFPGLIHVKILVIQEEDQKQLALYYTAASEVREENLKKHLAGALPEYMIPKYFVRLEEFPLNQNGKMDYKALPRPEISLEDQVGLMPSNQTQKTLARIFEDILTVKNISVTDHFFSLGGHSLKAIRVVSAIQKEFSVKVSLKEFFAWPDIRSLEEIIRGKKREELGIIPVVETAARYDLSHAQKRLWVLDKIGKSKSTYNIPLAISIYDELDAEAMQSSLDDMLRRHEALRTIFIEINGSPFQKIIEDQPILIQKQDFSREKDPDAAASEHIVAEAQRPFTLSEYPLIRLSILKLAAGKYILFLNIHHIICDGWSLNVMVDELFGRYRDYLNQTSASLSLPSIQYKDYAYWMNRRLNGAESIADRTYWLEKLGGELMPLDFPSDFRRPSVKTYEGNSIHYPFSRDFKKNLDTFCVEKRSSLFMMLTAALKVLFYRYTGNEDIIIGTPVAGRDHPDLEDQIGYYVNTLPLRDQINPGKTFAEFLEEIKKTATDAYSHQMYPFDKLVEELKLERDTSRSPLFDIMVVLQNADNSYRETFKRVEPYHVPLDISKFDLTFNFNDSGEDLELLIEYNTRLYQKERIDRMASHLLVLLREVMDHPAQSIGSVNILSHAETQDLLLHFNDTNALYPSEKTIVQLFAESVESYSSNAAVVYKDKILTYAELDALSDRMAGFIRKTCDVLPGEPIAVLVSPSENTVVMLLAILKAGAAYVPMDPEYPDERIRYILQESKTKLVLTQKANVARLHRISVEAACDCHIFDVDHQPPLAEKEDLSPVSGFSDPDVTAYIIFTSGSTGKPKGCPISHRNLVRLFFNDRNPYDFASSDVWIMTHSYCFDFSVWEMYGALLFGGKLIIPDREEVRDIPAFVRLVAKHQVTVLNQTPGAFYKFIDTTLQSKDKKALSLRYVIFGGDKLNPSKLEKWIQVYPTEKVRLINMYGITETTIHVTWHPLTDQEIIHSDGYSNIGKPLPETRVYLLDSHLQLVPVGVYGEIHVAGTGLSKGYLNRPDLTSERFICNPYVQNERLYKSGDIGRWLDGGTMEYLDRSDDQVQIRGFRVETAEVEIQLRRYKDITDTVVLAVEKEGTRELAAYIVSEGALKVQEIKGFLSTALPDYMIPSYFIQVEKIPLTSNGKLDKKNLPPAIQNIATGALFENPATKVEAGLLEWWQEILSVENISIHDNFFDLGGNSILLVKLYSKINSLYPEVMELTDLFSKSTIAGQAAYISQKTDIHAEVDVQPLERLEQPTGLHDIAVVGMACRIGACVTPDDFWEKLCQGADFIGPMPASRIDDIEKLSEIHGINPENLKLREYCYLPEIDQFDYGFFKLSPSEASLIDPGQRLFMETGYHALEDAGYGGDKLWGSRTGVFIGASDHLGEYNRYIEASENADPNLLLVAQTPSILASRLSYHLNLKGPALLVDTACSSSLVALHLACQSIREGKIDSALVGASKLHLLPLDSGSRMEIDAKDSRTRSFDDSSNGTGEGEGVIAVFLKPLEAALKDRDHLYAVIKGSEINQYGNSNGITAPNADAQADVIEKAWQDADIDPRSVSFIEAHGTATKLGDPIEIDGITKAFKRYTTEKSICAIGAVKANIGHLDTAAGLAGFLKAVLSIKNKQLTPLAHFKTPNRNIPFEESAAYINKDLKDWISEWGILRCGISSFGLSGTNCHVVLEEPPIKDYGKKSEDRPHLFTLSSRSKDGLMDYAEKMDRFLRMNPEIDPENLCYTLATGRGHYAHRLAIVYHNQKELVRKMSQTIDNELIPVPEDGIFYRCTKMVASNKKEVLSGEVTENDIRDLSNGINELIQKNTADIGLKLAAAYVRGANVFWEEYYAASAPAKITLPVYPFEKKRCWVQLKAKKWLNTQRTSYGKECEGLFLNHCIVDTPSVAVYANTLNENDWLLNEHRVKGVPTLVGVSYLQMACEAGFHHLDRTSLLFEDFYLLQPLTVREGKETEVLTTVNKQEDNSFGVDVQSKSKEDHWLSYAKFKVSELREKAVDQLDLHAIKARMPYSREVLPKGDASKEEPVQVSKKWACLNQIYWNDSEFLAELSVPEEDMALSASYVLYPPLIDAALSFALDESGFLPYSFGTVELRKKATGKMVSHIRKQANNASETRTFDITLAGETGDIIAVFRNFTLKKIPGQQHESYFHELVWKNRALKTSIVQGVDKTVILYNDACSQKLVKDFQSMGVSVCKVDKDHFEEVLSRNIPEKIIFLLPDTFSENGKDLESSLDCSLYSAFNFAKYLSLKVSSNLELLFVGQHVCEVSGDEWPLNSLNNAVAGLGQVIGQENPHVHCRFLDIDQTTSASKIMDEVNDGFAESYYYRAIRKNERFIREIKPVRLDEKKSLEITGQENGVYVITGGTGGIGLELALFLSRQANIKLALLSRSAFPPKDQWAALLLERKDEKCCCKIEKLQTIEEKAEIHFYATDVSDFASLKNTLDTIRKDLGRICGVIHAAGLPGDGFIFGKKMETFREVVKPKIQGTIYLSELLKADKPDFFLMTSALTAILPTSGQSDYTAANSFMDAYARELNRSGIHAQSINLTSWKETGMAYDHGVTDDGVFKSISTKAGIEAIGKIIQRGICSVILGEPDLSFLDTSAGLPFYLDESMQVSAKPQAKSKVEIHEVALSGKPDGKYTACEKAIAQVWGTVLGYPEINVTDNYYDLGGDSIHAIKINSLLEKQWNMQVTISDLFNHLTVNELAAFLDSKALSAEKAFTETTSSSQIIPVEKQAFYPVSSAQRRLFILDRLSKDKLSYHIPEIWNIKGKLRVDALISAFRRLIQRHEILRTSFGLVLDEPVQFVHDGVDLSIPVLKMGEEEARNHIRGFVRAFDLQVAPLFRVEMLELAPDHHLVLFDAHHIIIDAFSMEILKKDLFSFYEGRALEPLKIQYKDFSVWQNGNFGKLEIQEKKSWWMNQFQGEIPVINLPLDDPRSSNPSAEAGIFSFCIDEKLTAEIKKTSASQGLSTFMILLAVYDIVMHKYTGQDDIIIGVTTTGRDHGDLSGLLGMFVNNLPVRAFPEGEKTVRTFLDEVKQTVIHAFANQDYPFDELVENLHIKRDLNRSPLFDIVFSYMNFELSDIRTGEIQLSDYKAETVLSSEYDLMLYGLEAEDKIYITIKYKKSLFRKESIGRFAAHFSKTVALVTENSHRKISDMDFLLPDEMAQFKKYNRKSKIIVNPTDIIDLLKDSLLKYPEKTALLYHDQKMSYRELNKKSNKLAHYLRTACAVQPEDLVGIMLERTESMVIAMLGVIKSGAAYVGIDPAYPQQRIDYILKDSKARLLLTEQSILAKG
ncbi:MAG: amino acid adenylation domain-containing protein, partial [Bacteroidales bacterium]|nr:amino acid adenylation domain-containing protein [Bacteroidales bacterium]